MRSLFYAFLQDNYVNYANLMVLSNFQNVYKSIYALYSPKFMFFNIIPQNFIRSVYMHEHLSALVTFYIHLNHYSFVIIVVM